MRLSLGMKKQCSRMGSSVSGRKCEAVYVWRELVGWIGKGLDGVQ